MWSGIPLGYKSQISKIEGVQRFFCKRLQGLWSHPYRSRLAQLSMDSLYCRTVKADLLVCYKILHNQVHLNCDDFFSRSCIDRTRGNSMKLAKTHVYSARDSNFSPTVWLIFGMPYLIALSSLRPLIALNPKSIAFISVIFMLIGLFDYYIFLIFLEGAC